MRCERPLSLRGWGQFVKVMCVNALSANDLKPPHFVRFATIDLADATTTVVARLRQLPLNRRIRQRAS